MSHFSVLVIGRNVEGQLAPFDENMECEPAPEDYPLEDLQRMLDHYSECDEAKRTKHHALALKASIDENGIVVGVTHDELQFLFTDWSGGELRLSDAGYERMVTYNPESKWDWYQTGGRWSGYFKLKPGKEGVLGGPGVFKNEAEPGTADQVLKRDVDIQGMRDEAGYKADEQWIAVHAVIDGFPVPESWDSVRGRFDVIDEARDFYHSQSAIAALKGKGLLDLFDSVERYLVPQEQFVQTARDGALAPYAFVHRGQWVERGQMGWFGMSRNEKDTNDWNAEFNKKHAADLRRLPHLVPIRGRN